MDFGEDMHEKVGCRGKGGWAGMRNRHARKKGTMGTTGFFGGQYWIPE